MRPQSIPIRPMPLAPPVPFETALHGVLLARHGTGIAVPSIEIERLLAEWPGPPADKG